MNISFSLVPKSYRQKYLSRCGVEFIFHSKKREVAAAKNYDVEVSEREMHNKKSRILSPEQ